MKARFWFLLLAAVSISGISLGEKQNASDYGWRLPGKDLWWCGPADKVTTSIEFPSRRSNSIRLSGAGRERVHAQLILRAQSQHETVRVHSTDLKGPKGVQIPASAVRIREVAYVPVAVATDKIGWTGEWPDPLPELHGEWRPKPGRNNPLWITVTVPASCKPGDYTGKIILETGGQKLQAPMRLHVWNFLLPEKTDLRSGFGCSHEMIRNYHGVKTDEEMALVWDAYMRDFAEHRMNPYNPMTLSPYRVKLDGETSSSKVKIDFEKFDAAARKYLDELGFNAFTLHVQGLPDGRVPDFKQGSFMEHKAGSPEYDLMMNSYGQKLQEHLEKNGWLKKAYVYWYDEPRWADYPIVTEGMRRLKKYLPKVTRMLTEETQQPLVGTVDLWCPITSSYNPTSATLRQKAGEEMWWYICCGPKEPWCGEFIDHPGIELRMWLWQTWKYRLQGILIWETLWWKNPHKDQDPWTDTMSYSDSKNGTWGNGDGRFFYPPRPGIDRKDGAPVYAKTIDSMRWELLSIGIQDWEYFHMLEKLVEKAEAQGKHGPQVRKARALLTIPESVCKDMTHFAKDPQLLEAHRAKLAEAIEALTGR